MHVIGASGALSGRDIPDGLLRRFRALHLSGFFLLPRLDGEPSRRLLRRALQLGLTTSLDTCWDPWGRWNMVKMCLSAADYYLPSIEEARGTFGVRDPKRIARAALAFGVRKAVILKMGREGCFAQARSGEQFRLPACRVRAVDATGAGDAFDAGFLAGILRGWPLEKSLRLGNATGALVVAGMGGQGALRNLRQALRLAGLH
jgi:sugar/nucleoside kinase (ribokinase family)